MKTNLFTFNSKMNRFLTKVVLVLAPIFLFVVIVNYFGDAANLFSMDYEKKIANEILKGHHVTNITNYDERLLNKYLVNNSKSCPEVLVLGSSRVMLINSSHFAGQTFFNNGVSGASIEDLLGIYELYEKKGCLPKKLILGLDPWTLNINNDQKRWVTLKDEYYSIANKLTGSKTVMESDNGFSKLAQLVSPSYFKMSLKKIISRSPELKGTDQKMNNGFTKLADGSINYDSNYRTATAAGVEKRAVDYMNGHIYGAENFDKLSPEVMLVLERFIKYLSGKNIEVSFFLTPYHPKVYSFVSGTDKYKQVALSEKYFIDLGKKYNVEIIGSFNPYLLHMDNSDFYDGMHCNEKGIAELLKSKNGK
jgi:hypothetical protein